MASSGSFRSASSDEEKENDEEMCSDVEEESCDSDAEIVDDCVENGESISKKVYLPNQTDDAEKVPLEYDESAYVFYHQVKTAYPCLSFDVISDALGNDRADKFPLTMTLAAGTQAEKNRSNSLIIMKLSNLTPTKANAKATSNDDDEEEEEEDSDDEDAKPELDCATVPHLGCVNRLKVTTLAGTPILSSWSENGRVYLWDISHPLKAINNHLVMTSYIRNNEAPKPLFCFSGHQVEGYALAWSNLTPGMLATGDCKKDIHLWKPLQGGSWHIDQRVFKGHTASVEDIQWSPSEKNVMASCSSDKSIRIWDIRASPDKACMLTKDCAHDNDVNVISWNRYDPLILSGGDDGQIKVWDLRSFPNKPAVCTFKHHVAPITSVEWHPTDSSVFAASGSDDQLSVWDLAVERDFDLEQGEELSQEVVDLPPQLLFIHQGQTEIKELHWHSQMPGVLISTALTGFNVFRTISV